MQKSYILPPQTLAFSDRTAFGKRLHSFQASIMDVFDQKEEVLIVSAPTAAGKTYAFGLPTVAAPKTAFGRQKTMIVSPTNSLSGQIVNDLKKDWGEEISAIRLSASDIRARGVKKPGEIFQKIKENDIIVTNPDIISLLMSGFYYRWVDRPDKKRQWSDIFRRISLMIFDEFHIYPEEELAKILSFIILGNATGNHHVKYIFTSATPNKRLKELLEYHGITFKEVVERSQNDEAGGRRSRGAVELIFTDEILLSAVTPDCPDNKRTLFLFDRVVGYEKAAKKLEDSGVTDFEECSGFENRLENKSSLNKRSNIILATNAAEQGLNMDVDVAHIEPGRNLENFWQRYGRAARRGEDGQVIVHMDSERIKMLPERLNNYGELAEALEMIMDEREVYVSRIIANMSAYLFLIYKKSGSGDLKNQVWDAASRLSNFKAFYKFDKCVGDLREKLSFNASPQDIEGLEEWWNNFLEAHSWFRGQTETVRISHREGKISSGDYQWLLKNTEYSKSVDQIGEYFIVEQFLDEPKELSICFDGPGGVVRLSGSEISNYSLTRNKWERELRRFLADAFMCFKETRKTSHELMRLLPTILSSMHPSLLKPSGVDAFVDNQFL